MLLGSTPGLPVWAPMVRRVAEELMAVEKGTDLLGPHNAVESNGAH